MEFLDKVESTLGEHQAEVNKAVEAAGDLIDHKTGNKYGKQIDEGEAKLEALVEKNAVEKNAVEKKDD
jgi:hypothetical protein